MKFKKTNRIKKSAFKSRMNEIKMNGLTFNLIGIIPLIWALALTGLVIWGIMVSFADPNWYLDNSHTFLVKEFTLNNFADAVQKFKVQISNAQGVRWVQYFELFFNSIWFSIGGTFIRLTAIIFFAYAVSRYDFPGRNFLYAFVVVQMMLPIYGQTAANFSIFSKLGLVDSPLFLLGQGAGHGMYFLIMHSFFKNLPTGYVEAAKMDGAGFFTIFFKVMLPLARPVISAITIITLISFWNDYSDILIFLKSYPNLSSAMYTIKGMMFNLGLQTPSFFAAIFLSVLPVAILFIIFNKQIMNNVSLGGLKG